MLVDVSSSGNVRGKNKYQYCQSTLACFLSNLDLNMMRMIIKIHRVKTKVVQVSFWLQSYTLFFLHEASLAWGVGCFGLFKI